jgi:hypothetical protein
MSKSLTDDGRVYVTVFIGAGGKDYVENPPHMNLQGGPLHCCLYNQTYFEKLLAAANFEVVELSKRFQEENDGQYLYILKQKTK